MKLIFTRKFKKYFLQFPHFTKLLLLGGYLEETVILDAVLLLALSSPLSLCSSKEDCWKEHRLGTCTVDILGGRLNAKSCLTLQPHGL